MKRYEPFAKRLRVLDWTEPTPGLPLITALRDKPASIFDAVEKAIAALEDEDRSLLSVKGIEMIAKEDYLAIPNPP